MHSHQEKTKELIEKFWSAETTLEDEKEIADIAQSGNMEDTYTTAYFKMQQLYRSVHCTENLSITLEEIGTKKTTSIPLWVSQLKNIAAIFIIVVLLGVVVSYYQTYRSNQWLYQDTYQSSEQAFMAIKTAVKDISIHMDQGNVVVLSGLEQIDDIQDISH